MDWARARLDPEVEPYTTRDHNQGMLNEPKPQPNDVHEVTALSHLERMRVVPPAPLVLVLLKQGARGNFMLEPDPLEILVP